MAIPHLIVSEVLSAVSAVCALISWFAILFTGKWPAGLRGWVIKGLNTSVRLSAYAMMLTDVYPPFAAD